MVKGVGCEGRGDPGVRFDKLNELRGRSLSLSKGRKAGGGGSVGGVVPWGFVSTLRSFDKLRTVQAQQIWGWRSS